MLANPSQHEDLWRATTHGAGVTLDTTTNFPATHARHHDVEDHHIWRRELSQFPGLVAIASLHHPTVKPLHTGDHQGAQLGLIICDENR